MEAPERVRLHPFCPPWWTNWNRVPSTGLTDGQRLVLRLHHAFPLDRGCIAALFLNYIELQPGEATFLAAKRAACVLFMECSLTHTLLAFASTPR